MQASQEVEDADVDQVVLPLVPEELETIARRNVSAPHAPGTVPALKSHIPRLENLQVRSRPLNSEEEYVAQGVNTCQDPLTSRKALRIHRQKVSFPTMSTHSLPVMNQRIAASPKTALGTEPQQQVKRATPANENEYASQNAKASQTTGQPRAARDNKRGRRSWHRGRRGRGQRGVSASTANPN
ncbi:hypothetical protein BGZ63DRAFT_422289 [Mariannaea sp. PMI_226]|nr:hypothetical protein BGZ63DRAFT_422289 [Mariannaea sp. PMI_226]